MVLGWGGDRPAGGLAAQAVAAENRDKLNILINCYITIELI